MKKLLFMVPVLLLLAALPASSQTMRWENYAAASGTQGGFSPVANQTRLFGFMIAPARTDAPVTFSNIVFNVTTADTTAGSLCGAFADCYSVGIYSATPQDRGSVGALLASCAPMALNNTGVVDCAITQGSVTLAGGSYYFAFTGTAATAAITYATGNISFLSGGGPTAGGTTTNGALNSSLTPPADTWLLSSAKNIVFGLHN